MKTEAAPKAILLQDYQQPDYWITSVDLHFTLGEDLTRVRSRLTCQRNPSTRAVSGATSPSLVLNGESIQLEKISISGRDLALDEYRVTDTELIVYEVPDSFILETITTNQPDKNLACEGLYMSGPIGHKIFCTQCEAESFRKITYYLDRPDVMAIFTVTINADKKRFPVLLSNGNLISAQDLADGRHEAVWHDPYKKPCYLFALVAGDLDFIEDQYRTTSGRDVTLRIFARKGLTDRCSHAMKSLQLAMKWDEDTYGLEYDLDIFMIVVAEDFNMGAMENKGLNVFNANYVLANPQTATDADYDAILAVVGHEYFHNWTGNRITCRDWFQLSLKEGLTVFRDQRFSGDLGSASVKRIEDVIRLRTYQFAEDAGPMAHPIRPRSYLSIDNFYTLTIYEKGAEVIRMIETILGREGFRKGMNLYFQRHDGQAVTTEDFVAAMADANHIDLTQFRNWYDQAGTPLVKAKGSYDAKTQKYTLELEQKSTVASALPFHIPVAIGLLGTDGKDLPLTLSAAARDLKSTPLPSNQSATTLVLQLLEAKASFTFTGVTTPPVLSLLRGFSAPVKIEFDYSDDELAFLMAHDSDPFARWEAAQMLTLRTARELVDDFSSGRPARDTSRLTQAFGPVLENALDDPNFVSFMLALPAEQYIAQFYEQIDVDAIFMAREHLLKAISKVHFAKFRQIYLALSTQGTEGEGARVSGERSLRSRTLEYLVMNDDPQAIELALQQRRNALNMTDEIGALSALNRSTRPERKVAMQEFYEKWKDETLVMNKWLVLQAVAPVPDAVAEMRRLAQDPVFDKNNPNKIYSLYLAFAKYNLVRFHEKSGLAYRFLTDQILDIDARNPQVAARLMSAFNQLKNLDQERQARMQEQLERILKHPNLSTNVYEIASKTLGQ